MGDALKEFMDGIGTEGEDLLLLVSETAELVDYYRRLLERLELDALTGLPGANKYHTFTSGIESRVKTLGMVFFDVNDLKFYNDNKGHHAGDLLLQKAAESLIIISDAHNIHSFRLGGDEFVTVVTDCIESDLDTIMERWRASLAELNKRDDGITCSVSAGVAFGAAGYKLADVLELADKRMYEDKVKIKAARGQTPR